MPSSRQDACRSSVCQKKNVRRLLSEKRRCRHRGEMPAAARCSARARQRPAARPTCRGRPRCRGAACGHRTPRALRSERSFFGASRSMPTANAEDPRLAETFRMSPCEPSKPLGVRRRHAPKSCWKLDPRSGGASRGAASQCARPPPVARSLPCAPRTVTVHSAIGSGTAPSASPMRVGGGPSAPPNGDGRNSSSIGGFQHALHPALRIQLSVLGRQARAHGARAPPAPERPGRNPEAGHAGSVTLISSWTTTSSFGAQGYSKYFVRERWTWHQPLGSTRMLTSSSMLECSYPSQSAISASSARKRTRTPHRHSDWFFAI